jgi:3-oxoacyl-[acyl-carrier-protein] synthase-3
MGARIISSGRYLPERCVTNGDLERLVDTSDEWIVRRTGIKTRYLLGDEDDPAEMGVEAGKSALKQAGLSPVEVDFLIVATNFPDTICPGSSPFIATGLGLDQTPFFDLKAGCTGFVYGMVVAGGLIEAGLFRRILVVGSEALSRVTDWNDRKTCVLFGDGAGAALMGAGPPGEGILGSSLHAEGDKAMLLHIPAGGTRSQASHATVAAGGHYLKMEGAGVYHSAVSMMERATEEALGKAGLALSDIDWLIPHQANIRIINSLTRRLGIEPGKVIVNLDRVANTSTASIPIALDEVLREGKVNRGDRLVLTAFGAGASYGAVVLKI